MPHAAYTKHELLTPETKRFSRLLEVARMEIEYYTGMFIQTDSQMLKICYQTAILFRRRVENIGSKALLGAEEMTLDGDGMTLANLEIK